MTTPKTKFPIESFGPQLMAALVGGGRSRLIIPFEGPLGKKLAHNFQRRIHMLRSRMRELNHPDYIVAARAKATILWGEKAADADPKFEDWRIDFDGRRGAIIVIAPRDSEFEEVLAKAGVGVGTTPTAPTILPPHDDLNDLLIELQEKQPGNSS